MRTLMPKPQQAIKPPGQATPTLQPTRFGMRAP